MHCTRLSDLPPAPAGKRGWPWTEESECLPSNMPNGVPWPGITFVTPSYNQGKFIEETLRSILLQGYPALEYFVLDGGSTDDSVEIIQKYSPWITYWVSERDGGQSDAINRGLKMGSGTYAAWINSDDLLCRNAIFDHASRIGFDESVVYVGKCCYIDEQDKISSFHSGRIHSLEELLQIPSIWSRGGSIDQPAVLFPRDLALSVGALDRDNHLAMDYELWGKFFLAGARFEYTGVHFGIFRQHRDQKTCDMLSITESMLTVAANFVRAADRFSKEEKSRILAELHEYGRWYKQEHWTCSGRLARLGLPTIIVKPLRRIRVRLQERLNSYAWRRRQRYS